MLRHPSSHPFDELTFTVDIKSKDSRFRTFRGRVRHSQVTRTVFHLADIEQLVALALKMSHFTSNGSVYSQVRGSPIGSPASPAICHLTVAFLEHVWVTSWSIPATPHHIVPGAFITRCVDNRLIITQAYQRTWPEFRQLLSFNFYEDPVELENVGDQHLVGYDIDIEHRTITPILPTKSWSLRSHSCASTGTVKISGFLSRLHSIVRCTWPKSAILTTQMSLYNSTL